MGKRRARQRTWTAFDAQNPGHLNLDIGAKAAVAQKCLCWRCLARGSDSVAAISMQELEETMCSFQCRSWESGRFRLVKKLQDAPRNHGSVDEMVGDSGLRVAVKKMPNWWVQSRQEDFSKKYPKQVERPWWDFTVVKELENLNFTNICSLVGIFQDQQVTYVVSSLATDGDLFSWSQQLPTNSEKREAAVRPIVIQLFEAVHCLHDFGIAHRDLSLENILLTRATSTSTLQVKLIDFGMSTVGRMCEPGQMLPGKDIYRAPEVYSDCVYDAFLADNFSLGLVLYSVSLLDYPWTTTEPGKSTDFDYVRRKGAALFLKSKKKVRGQALPDILSLGLISLMAGLLAPDPNKRYCFGMTSVSQVCAWTSPWLTIEADCASTRAGSSASLSTMAPDSDEEPEHDG
eukprot:TRINITY_DN108037_c0_g1_i1.p1 TRINITY_DN108037_c0_g1~~TRINITY_DN108037_c0_g1_i1.p1  ORF type:complete len:413 (+),score=60.59 TRINITY_DN108037_c0_g1_i1:35-1240(+)